MPVTIKDVARLAEVSPSTVTRVIQDKPSISAATKKRVRRAMKELNYHPNINARSLASNKTNVIGVVLPKDSDAFYQNSFFPEVIRGISQIAADHHYLIQLCTGKDNAQRLHILKDMILGKRVDGIIFLYGEMEDPLVELVIEEKFPAVIIGKSLSPFISFVDNNNEKAGYDATEYLIQQNCRQIGFLSGSNQLFVSHDRLSGYKKALREYNLPLNELIVSHVGEFTRERGYCMMKSIMEHDMIDGLITTDSLLTEGALQYLAENNIRIPVITYDSVRPSATQLTAYVDIHTLELGKSAFQLLQDVIASTNEHKQMYYRSYVDHTVVPL